MTNREIFSGQNRENSNHFLEAVVILGSLWAISNLAFSLKVRKEIGQRDGWTCQDEGCDDGNGEAKSYKNGWMVQASHYDHDKKKPNYDTAEAGRIQCIDHHEQYHEKAKGQAVTKLGMTCEEANEFAVMALKRTEKRTAWWKKMMGQ